MAITLKAQIDNLVGTGLASTAYDNWIMAGARTIVDILKPEDLERHSSSVVVANPAGLAVQLYRIWKVLVNGYDATQYPAGYETQIVDSNSFHKSSAFTPAYIINAGTLKCYNGAQVAGSILGIAYPSAVDSSTDTEIVGVPENMHYAVILYSAIQARIKQISNLYDTITTALSSLPATVVSSLDLETEYSQLLTYTNTTEDIELAQAQIGVIQSKIEIWLKSGGAGEVVIELQNAIQKLAAQVQTYNLQLQNYNIGFQNLQSEYHEVINLYLGGMPGGSKQ